VADNASEYVTAGIHMSTKYTFSHTVWTMPIKNIFITCDLNRWRCYK